MLFRSKPDVGEQCQFIHARRLGTIPFCALGVTRGHLPTNGPLGALLKDEACLKRCLESGKPTLQELARRAVTDPLPDFWKDPIDAVRSLDQEVDDLYGSAFPSCDPTDQELAVVKLMEAFVEIVHETVTNSYGHEVVTNSYGSPSVESND